MSKLQNLIGQRFGKLTVFARGPNSKGGKATWFCKCDCGNIKKKPVTGHQLKSGRVTSCGCRYKESNKYNSSTHNQSKTRLYTIWTGMKGRCKRNKHYRNIKICDEWQEFVPFREWAVSNGYSDSLTIDRIDNNGDYCPDNCRWATYKQQENNRSNNTKITYNGVTHTIAEWSEITGIDACTISQRLHRGYNTNELFLKPYSHNQPSRRA